LKCNEVLKQYICADEKMFKTSKKSRWRSCSKFFTARWESRWTLTSV